MRLVLLRTGETYVSGRIMEDKSIDTATPERIIELFFGRDEQAIEMTDRLYRGQLLKIAYNITRDLMISEEVLNDAYLALWNRIPPARPGSLRAYSSVIVRNIAVDRMRRENASSGSLPAEELDECIPDSACPDGDGEELEKLIARFLRKERKTARVAFVIRYFEGETVEGVAKRTGMSVPAVKSSLHRTRRRLRAFLAKEGYEL